MKNKRVAFIVFATAIVLLIPLIAMQFTPEVNWNLADFFIAGTLLLGTGFLCELVLKKRAKPKYRIPICVAILLLLLLVWSELAVGIIEKSIGESY